MSLPNIGCINNNKVKTKDYDHLGDNKDLFLCVKQAKQTNNDYAVWKPLKKCNIDCPEGMTKKYKNGECFCVQQPTNDCDMECVKNKCTQNDLEWVDLDYKSKTINNRLLNPYTCRIKNTKRLGTCYATNKYNFIVDREKCSDTNNNFQVFSVPENIDSQECENNLTKCLKNTDKLKLINEISILNNELEKKKTNLEDVNVLLYNLDNNLGLTFDKAKEKYLKNQTKIKDDSKKKNYNIINDNHNKLYSSLSSQTQINNIQLSDKNKIISFKNSEVNRSYNDISKLNDELNTITKKIYKNQSIYNNNDQMTKILKAILIICVILACFMVIYYSVQFAKDKFPDQFNSFKNNFPNTNLFSN